MRPAALISLWGAIRRLLMPPVGMLREALRAYPVGVAAVTLIELSQGVLPVGQAWLMRELFDGLAQRGPNLVSRIASILVGLVILSAVGLLIMPISQYLFAEADRRLTLQIQLNVYGKLNSFTGVGYFEDPKLHDLVQMSAQRAQHAPITAVRVALGIGRAVVTTTGFVAVLIGAAPWLAVAVLVTVIPELMAQFGFGRQRFDLVERQIFWRRLAFYYSFLLGSPLFVREIRTWGIGGYFLNQFRDVSQNLNSQQRALQIRQLRSQVLIGLGSTLATTSMLAVVVLKAATGSISIGEVSLFLTAVAGTQGAALSIVFSLAQLNETSLFYRRYRELLELKDSVSVSKTPRRIAAPKVGIEFKDVRFAYSPGGPEVLKGVSLRLPEGTCTALVGVNGAGKSTLVKLLARFYDPTGGSITWDRVDLRDVDPAELRRLTSAVFQDFARYELTARENIGVGDVHRITDASAVQRAAISAGAHSIISALPEGYETVLSRSLGANGGVDLSGGQWQSIALARMLMRDSALVILDEPTAALDAEAEYAVYCKFREIMKKRTSLLISHRFSTVSMADYIAVLENGQIIEYGTHDQLVALGGSYARLYRLQADRYSAVP